MKGLIRMAAVLVVSLAVAKIVAALLNTRPARRLAQGTGTEALLTSEGKDVVQKYSRAMAALVLGAVLGRRKRKWSAKTAAGSLYAGWPATLDDAADMISAGGSLVRLIADFWRERLELDNRRGAGPSRIYR